MKKLYSFILALFCLTTYQRSAAQTINFLGELMVDGGICSLNDTTHIVGSISINLSCASPYYIECNFGDGAIDTIQFVGCPYQSVFTLAHQYSAIASYTLSLRSFDSVYNATDTVQTVITIGNCQKATGTYFFDCNQNCEVDSFEQPVRSRVMNFLKNNMLKQVYVDSLGRFSIPVYPGDSYIPGDPNFPGMEIREGCWGNGWNLTPITTGVSNYRVPVVIENGTMNLNAFDLIDSLLCRNLLQSFPWSVSHSSTIFGDEYGVVVKSGDGNTSSYANGASFFGNYYHLYSDTGVFTVKIELYHRSPGGNFYGPIMVKEKIVHLKNCHPVNVKYYSDVNENCQHNTTEFQYNMNYGYGLLYSAVRNGANPFTLNTDGSVTTYIWGNDTVYRPEYLNNTNLIGWGNNSFQVLPRTCNPNYITKLDDSVKFAYNPAINLGDIDDYNTPYYCKGDTLTYTLHGNTIGYPGGTALRFLAIYTDGFTDTFDFTPTVIDSFSYTFRKRVLTTDTFSAIFVLSGSNGLVADTATKSYVAGNCALVKVKAYYDRNKNCIKDANEIFLKNFKVESQNASSEYNPIIDSQTVRLNIYIADDTLMTVKLYPNSQFGSGIYIRTFTEPICGWPVFPYDTGTYIIPLVDTTYVDEASLVNGYNVWPETTDIDACENTYHPTLKGWLYGNRNAADHYYFKYSAGTGALADSVAYPFNDDYSSISHYYYISAPNTVYSTGTYIPNYLLINNLAQDTVLHYQRPAPALTVNLNCQAPKAQLFVDEDGDCLKNTSEPGIGNIVVAVVKNGNSFNTITDADGRVYFNAANGDQIVITVPQNLNSGKALDTNCVSGNSTAFVYNTSNPIPGFPYACDISAGVDLGVVASHSFYTNLQSDTIIIYPQFSGCFNDSAVLSLTLDNSINFVAASLPGHQQSGNTVYWNIADLNTLQGNPVKVAISLNNNQANFLCNTIKLYAAMPDADSGNNEFTLCDSVYSNIPIQIKTGITDSLYLQTNTPIIYSVHFQNTTTDTLSQVIVVDTISAALNINSLQILNTSHYYILSIENNNVLRFIFPNINMLPGEGGLVQFLLNPSINITQGAVIYNNAAIVYGGNGTVMTGPASTAARPPDPSSTEEIPSLLSGISLVAFPNPTTGALKVIVSGERGNDGYLLIYDLSGRLLMHQKAGKHTDISMRSIPSGIYLLKYEDSKWNQTIKVVKTE